ncbi:MAG TPA: phage tail sheath subtilisin-like domain-containing protein [Anaerolineae bacterium]|nr:phage tail sheath subtilisin-like domain-containing protein [Anaerolineae bacterium]HQI84236.1 phage tail sheath subtilisin-like domain-containing protein [Anaerolineae bacterium]
MPEYLSPGVYVEEIDRGPKPIEGVGTAMAAFVGFSEKAEIVREIDGELVTEDLLNRPQLVTNWTQFVERYGDFVPGAYLAHSVYGYFLNGGTRCYVVSVRTIPKAQAALLNSAGKPQLVVKAKQAGFEGLRLRVKVADVAELPAPKAKAKGKEEETPAAEAESPAEGGAGSFTLIVEREKLGGGWKVMEEIKDVTLHEVKENGQTEVRVAYKDNRMPSLVQILVPEAGAPLAQLWPRAQEQTLTIESKQLPAPTSSEFQGKVTERTGVEGLEALEDVTMVVVPDLMSAMPGEKVGLDTIKAVQTMMIAHSERLGDRVAILDAPPDLTPQEVKKWRMDIAGFDSSYAAMYYPWITVMDPATNRPINIPPSGHIAGVWARNDTTRGVHKAPANEVVQGAIGLAYQTTKGEQDTLNPIGVNCIRGFPGRGIRVWGARTLSSNPSWRYINVRRLFNMVEKSIEGGTQWVVFEPNDRKLWARVRRDVTAFLRTVWRTGALFGNTPEEAFYVKCDDELNPPETRDLGQLIIEIGLAPVKPAEFVIFRISQWAGPGSE